MNKKRRIVFLTTGAILCAHYETFNTECNIDVLVIDEGHKAKNIYTKLRKCLKETEAKQKILLTGTPVQNTLDEFYSLIDLVEDGLLGTPAEFKMEYSQ